ncbi:hypothetical protein NA57DRAFT_38374 [Rhizodiscina lignyota]|uniref:mRNA 3'-end-processing protein n=1 Tax=Rhizodiscina lignyota TaxID=1504668 RepID=A0A9P4IGZ3_9PEZI|nr:hypothetical protein NA57DRAFT_38374 [Rhizodiscina lignyota]
MAAELQNPTPVPEAPRETPASGYSFSFDEFLKREYRYGLDPNRPVCKAYLQGHCPLGNSCPDKHNAAGNTFQSTLVCKHWLRGLCKKGEACEFLHEYNLRRMPECNYWSRFGTCSNGDDCLYLHPDPESKRAPCPHYERGFCPLGPHCANRHVKRDNICPFYMAGFCPDGKACKAGAHPRFPEDLKKPEVKIIKSKEQLEQERLEKEAAREREEEQERERGDSMGGQQRFGKGGWQKQRGGRQKRQRRGNF